MYARINRYYAANGERGGGERGRERERRENLNRESVSISLKGYLEVINIA